MSTICILSQVIIKVTPRYWSLVKKTKPTMLAPPKPLRAPFSSYILPFIDNHYPDFMIIISWLFFLLLQLTHVLKQYDSVLEPDVVGSIQSVYSFVPDSFIQHCKSHPFLGGYHYTEFFFILTIPQFSYSHANV